MKATMLGRSLYIFQILIVIMLMLPPHLLASTTTTVSPSTVEIVEGHVLTFPTSDMLINNCTEAILNNDLDSAMELLNTINSDNKLYIIVKNIFDLDRINGFDILLNLSVKFEDINRRYMFYYVLCNEVIKNDLNNGFMVIKLSQAINDFVVNHSLEGSIKSKAIKLLEILKDRLKKINLHFLISSYSNYTTEFKSGNKLLNETFYFDQNLFEDVHKEFLFMANLRKNYDDAYLYLQKLFDIRNISEQYFSWSTMNLFSSKEHPKKLNLFEMYKIGETLKKLELKYNDKELSDKYRKKLNLVKSKSLYNLIFSNRVCIRNVGLNEYLNLNVNSQGNYLYTTITKPRETWPLQTWTFRVDVNYVQICEQYNRCLYKHDLYSSDIYRVYITNHYNGYWNIELDELDKNHVHLKFFNGGGYLYGSGGHSDIPTTWRTGDVYLNDTKTCINKNCIWHIEDCSDIDN